MSLLHPLHHTILLSFLSLGPNHWHWFGDLAPNSNKLQRSLTCLFLFCFSMHTPDPCALTQFINLLIGPHPTPIEIQFLHTPHSSTVLYTPLINCKRLVNIISLKFIMTLFFRCLYCIIVRFLYFPCYWYLASGLVILFFSFLPFVNSGHILLHINLRQFQNLSLEDDKPRTHYPHSIYFQDLGM